MSCLTHTRSASALKSFTNRFLLKRTEEDADMNDEIIDGIRNKKMQALTDASMLHNQMRRHWKIVDFDNNTIKSKEIFNKKWGVNIPKVAEAATILDMLECVKGLTETNLEGKMIVINDNKLLNNEINEKMKKAGQCANDAG